MHKSSTPKNPSNRPPLLFIHGYRGASTGLANIAAKFPDYPTYAPNVPPAGGTKLPAYTAATYSAFIADYIKNHIAPHHRQKPILIGHSLGSIITAATAQNYPDLINQKLILLAPISRKPATFFAHLVPLTAVLPTRTVDYLTTRYNFVPHDKALFKQALKHTNTCSATYSSKTEVKRAGRFSASTAVSDYSFHKDALIVVGQTDHLIPHAATAAYAQSINAHLVTVPGTGHLLNYENPAAVTQAIRQFLEKPTAR